MPTVNYLFTVNIIIYQVILFIYLFIYLFICCVYSSRVFSVFYIHFIQGDKMQIYLKIKPRVKSKNALLHLAKCGRWRPSRILLSEAMVCRWHSSLTGFAWNILLVWTSNCVIYSDSRGMRDTRSHMEIQSVTEVRQCICLGDQICHGRKLLWEYQRYWSLLHEPDVIILVQYSGAEGLFYRKSLYLVRACFYCFTMGIVTHLIIATLCISQTGKPYVD